MLSTGGQLVFDGLAMGLVFVILAAGMVIIMSVSRILFFAYGMLYSIGAYATWFAVNRLELPYYISLPLGVLFAAALGMLSYIIIFQRFQGKAEAFLATMIAAMGLSMLLSQSQLLAFGTVPRSISTVFPGVLRFLGMTISVDKLVLVILGVVVTLLLFWAYEKTAIGRAMRAVSFNPEAATLFGINSSIICMVSFGLGCALAGFAGGILAPSYGVSQTMGMNILWTVFLLTMLGGMNSLLGAVVAGVIVGQILSFGQFLIGGAVQIILFVIIGIILYFKPMGLFGH